MAAPSPILQDLLAAAAAVKQVGSEGPARSCAAQPPACMAPPRSSNCTPPHRFVPRRAVRQHPGVPTLLDLVEKMKAAIEGLGATCAARAAETAHARNEAEQARQELIAVKRELAQTKEKVGALALTLPAWPHALPELSSCIPWQEAAWALVWKQAYPSSPALTLVTPCAVPASQPLPPYPPAHTCAGPGASARHVQTRG